MRQGCDHLRMQQGRKQFLYHFATVFRSWIGLAFIGMPYGFMRAGWLGAILILVYMSAVSAYCSMLLVQTKYLVRQRQGGAAQQCVGYGDVVLHVFGGGSAALDATLFFTTYGFCVSYCMFLLENLASSLKGFLLAALLTPMMFIEDISKLGPSSFAGSAAMFGALFLCYCVFDWQSLLALFSTPRIPAVDIQGLPVFVGMAATATCGIGIVLPFEESLQRGRLATESPGDLHSDHSAQIVQYFFQILWAAVGVCSVILISFGLLGSQTYGHATRAVVTLNMEPGTVSSAITVALCASVLAACPLQFVVLRTVSEHHLMGGRSVSQIVRSLWRVAVVLCLVWIALHFPDFGLLSGFIGALGGSLLSFVVPLMCYLKVQTGHLSHRQWLLHVMLLLLCVAAMIVSTLVSLSEIWARLG